MQWIYLKHEFHNLSWITEINELFHYIIIDWDAPAFCMFKKHSQGIHLEFFSSIVVSSILKANKPIIVSLLLI